MRFSGAGLGKRDMILGSGAVLHCSNGCITLHAVEALWPRTRMPHARGVAPVRRDPPETRRHQPPKRKTVALPVSPLTGMPPAATRSCYAAGNAAVLISTPSGNTPVSTKRQSEINSFLAMATMAIRRVRPAKVPTRWRNHPASALPGW